jgi:hypothetical protein
LLAWGFLVVVMAAYALGIDRTFLIDQPNYLDNFANAPSLEWLSALSPKDAPVRGLIIGVFSEEVLWQVWATVLGMVFSPAVAVVVTVCILNLLVALAVRDLPNPALALIVWLLVPVGFAVTGLLQLRQGFAFAVLLYVSLRLNRPVLATFLAAMIHTTFALALPFVMIAWLFGRQELLALLLSLAIAAVAAYVGGMLFEAFGGRRVAIYDVNQAETNSVLYVLSAVLSSLPSLHRLLFGPAPEQSPATSRTLASLAVIHIAVNTFTAVSFFVFPLGAGRVGYLTMLLLIPILPTVRRRDSLTGAMVFGLILLYLVYLTVKTYLEGTYDILLSS